jgi:hypothetical protein
VVEFGREVVERFRPVPVFVLDVAAVGSQLALIELNGFNSAGFYASDVDADVSRLVSGAHPACV